MRYLTKSRFKLGLECPTKLYYTGKELFPNQKQVDPFLQQLANGGFQVEALARLMYENGDMIADKNRENATTETTTKLKQNNALLYEASFLHDGLHVRTDIVQKTENHLRLIEVKAKSSRSSDSIQDEFLQKNKKKLDSNWESYLWDLAFQTHVAQKMMPEMSVSSFLLLVDKDAVASIDGIHQKFKITNNSDDQRMNIIVEKGLKYDSLENDLLVEKDVSEIILRILSGDIVHSENGLSFLDNVKMLSENYAKDNEMNSPIGRKCKDCEFRLNDSQVNDASLISGFNRCWIKDGRVRKDELSSPKTYNIFNSGFAKKVMIEDSIVLAKNLSEDHIYKPSKTKKSGFSMHERQALQLEDIKSLKNRKEFNEEALKSYWDKMKFPLNMIDFETCTTAIPFTKGMRPYETIAFQFSHHVVYEDGRVEHANQWICTDPHKFPNFDFVRALKDALGKNEGSIFRFHNHENTVLNEIKQQLTRSKENDKDILISFIEEITSYEIAEGKAQGWRCMIDLHRLINDCYHNTHFAHSLSLKVVLPAVIHTDEGIQSRYANSIAEIGVSSLNFDDSHSWLKPQHENGLDPYKHLPLPFEGFTDEELADFFLSNDNNISNGGTAMMVYAKMQFTEMSNEERKALELALYKYCELDTLAMVMVFEHLWPVFKSLT